MLKLYKVNILLFKLYHIFAGKSTQSGEDKRLNLLSSPYSWEIIFTVRTLSRRYFSSFSQYSP